MGWLPIETAPKDGTLIDVWDGYERVIDVKWGHPENCGRPDLGREKTWIVLFLYDSQPDEWDVLTGVTHWMPQPKPPTD